MLDVLTIAGSPTQSSRSAAILDHIRDLLEQQGFSTAALRVRDLNAEDLFYARFDSSTVRTSVQQVAEARAILITTPIYKASYSGALKTFLDVLPQQALANKVVLPIATAGSAAHWLALDYAFKPVLAALGAQYILRGLYLTDTQIQFDEDGQVRLDVEAEKRLQEALHALTQHLALFQHLQQPLPFPALVK